MAGEGFEYVSWVPPDTDSPSGADSPFQFPDGFSPIDFVLDSQLPDESSENQNPNDAVLESLSDTDREGYLDALWAPEGCAEISYREATSQFDATLGPEIAGFEDALDGINIRIASDVRVIEAEAEFSNCLYEASGLALPNENAIVGHFEEVLGPAVLLNAGEAVEGEMDTAADELERAVGEARPMEAKVMGGYESCSPGLVSTRRDVQREVVDDLMNRYGAQIDDLLDSSS